MNEIFEKISHYVDVHTDEMVDVLKNLVLLESGYKERENVEKTAAYFVELLRDAGCETLQTVEVAPNRAPLIIADFFTSRKKPAVLLSGHLDTVFAKGSWGEHPCRVENGKIYGPGVSDMKGGMVMGLYIIKALQAAGYQDRPFRFIIVCEEEGDHVGTCADLQIQEYSKGCGFAFNLEPGIGEFQMVTARKEQHSFYCKVHGVGGHAGNEPLVSKSALMEAVYKLAELVKLADDKTLTTVSPTTIHTGFEHTAIPAEAEFTVDVRVSSPEERDRIYAGFQEIMAHSYIEGTTAEYTVDVAKMPPWRETPQITEMFDVLNKAAAALGIGEYEKILRGGVADSGNIAAAGVPLIDGCGIVGHGLHSFQETATIKSLVERTKVLACTIAELNAFGI